MLWPQRASPRYASLVKSVDPARSFTTFKLPEPPVAPSPNEPAPVVVYKVDWEAVGFKENKGKLAFIIDNALTPEDCQKLLKAGEDSAPWSVAAIHGGPGDQTGTVVEDYRKSSRIILDDSELADFILSKLKPHMPEEAVKTLTSKYRQFRTGVPRRETDKKKKERETLAQLTRLNERLRYLKYVEGDFFESHCDGFYWTPDRSEVSCLTLQLYLNGSKKDLEGGATQFSSKRTPDTVVDVDPRPGRALIFEQGTLLHCGAKVLKGEKYTIRTDLMYTRVSA